MPTVVEKREREYERGPILPPLAPLSCILSPPRVSSISRETYSNYPIQKKYKTKNTTDGLKHFSSLPSPWGIPLVGHGPLLGRAPAATLKRWADKYGGVYR